MKPPSVNFHKLNTVFSIYSTLGYGDFRKFVGMGFMIGESLAITTHMILPNPHHANHALAFFIDTPEIPNRLNATAFFYTNRELNFTIVGFIISDPSFARFPLPLH